jgi:hypothetical protein
MIIIIILISKRFVDGRRHRRRDREPHRELSRPHDHAQPEGEAGRDDRQGLPRDHLLLPLRRQPRLPQQSVEMDFLLFLIQF